MIISWFKNIKLSITYQDFEGPFKLKIFFVNLSQNMSNLSKY